MPRLMTIACLVGTVALTLFALHLISTVFFWLLFMPAGLSLLYNGMDGAEYADAGKSPD